MEQDSFDLCECGDFRWRHAAGIGRCLVCPARKCSRFRFSSYSSAEEIRHELSRLKEAFF